MNELGPDVSTIEAFLCPVDLLFIYFLAKDAHADIPWCITPVQGETGLFWGYNRGQERLGSISFSSPHLLCHLGQVISSRWASGCPSVKWV